LGGGRRPDEDVLDLGLEGTSTASSTFLEAMHHGFFDVTNEYLRHDGSPEEVYDSIMIAHPWRLSRGEFAPNDGGGTGRMGEETPSPSPLPPDDDIGTGPLEGEW
jgi:hypothetical protein